jgi:hypothetical protein
MLGSDGGLDLVGGGDEVDVRPEEARLILKMEARIEPSARPF